jgi:pimeloyl-ACP methyl ester carboxylesterase
MSVPANSSPSATQETAAKGHIGLVVLASIAAGLALGLVLVLAVFAGADEPRTTGSALFALGAGFALLAIASARYTSQPQPWALVPGLASLLAGVAVALIPTGHGFDITGWVWPLLLAALVVSSVRGAQRSLANWSRRALLYPALVILSLIAVGGAAATVMTATSSDPAPTRGHTYLVNGHRLYLNCTGTGFPTVVLFNGLGERTPSWAWVQANVSASTRVCSFDRAGEGWSGGTATAQDGPQMASDAHALLAAAHVPGPYIVAGHSVGGTYALVYAEQYPRQIAGVALIDSSTPYQFDLPEYPRDYSMMKRAYALMPTVARTAMGKLMLRSGHGTLPPPARNVARSFASSPRELRADRIELLQLPTIFNEAKALHTLNGKPLAVVSAGVGEMRGWTAAQNKLAQLSTNSTHRTVAGAAHETLLEDESFARFASAAITHVVKTARSADR